MALKELPTVIKTGMNVKKQHEVAYLSALINSVAESQNIDRIMDIGAGQGYLDICLAFQYNKTVIGVDDDEIQTCGAKRRTDLVNKKLYTNASPQGRVYHINRRVRANETFAAVVKEVSESMNFDGVDQEATDLNSGNDGTGGWLLCGLHACGDLTPAIIKHFLDSDATALVICFYVFVFVFWLIAIQRAILLAKPRYGGRKVEVLFENGLMERARANSKSSTDHDIIIGRMKGPAPFAKGFPHYAKLALSRLKIDTDAEGLSEERLKEYENRYKSRENEIAIVWTLRSLLGEVFESLLLADRYQFLLEQCEQKGLDRIELIPLFDPVASPRNMVLICTKQKIE
ncbi:UNVERIFIED_CONTAM: hypothetical protein HDU68_003066 [Siphonaria sp. JEL0065]|nr:hypothetical protein HDU68_003066 [Siphonaria sp. JEL0065]